MVFGCCSTSRDETEQSTAGKWPKGCRLCRDPLMIATVEQSCHLQLNQQGLATAMWTGVLSWLRFNVEAALALALASSVSLPTCSFKDGKGRDMGRKWRVLRPGEPMKEGQQLTGGRGEAAVGLQGELLLRRWSSSKATGNIHCNCACQIYAAPFSWQHG